MAQLNDLLVLGNTSLIGEVQVCEKITAPVFEGDLSGNATTADTATKTVAGLKIGSKTFNGSTGVEITPGDLGLSSAMKFLGTTTTAITDGAKTNPITVNSVSTSVTSGNVVLYGQKEFVWTSSGAWEELGNEGSYKIVQTAVADPSTSGASTDLNYIYSITQDTNGVITPTKKTIPTATSSVLGAVKLSDAINSTSGASAGVAATPAAVKTTYDRAETKLPLAGGNMTGHIYLTGSKAGSSTANTSQLIFGTSSNEHVAISSNDNTLVINPTSGTTTNQIVLYLDSPSAFPSGLNVGANSTFSNALSVGTNLTVGNNATITNDLTVSGATSLAKALTFTGTSASASKIHFSRTNNPSYFTAGTGGYFCFVPNGQPASVETSDLIINDGTVRPGTTNVTSLGTSSYKWSNVYATKFTGDVTGNLTGNVTGNVSGSSGSCTGNAATATKLATARTIRTKLNSTSTASFDGSGNITPGVTGTLGIGNGGTGATTKEAAWSNLLPFYTSPWSTQAEDTGNNWAALGNSSVTWWPESATGIYGKPSPWGLVFTVSASSAGSQEMHQLWFSQANGAIYHRGGNGSTATSMQANSWAKLWQTGDSVTGAVWNDYAECRESDCEDFGYVLMETGDDSLTKTTERLSHFAGISSDTWGFSQGETEKAKTPIAVAGRVLAYTYQDRNNYKPGDCVCAAPGGTVDIMTREEIINWPDRIVGTVSCVPEYDEWGGGEGADRDPIKVNNRIWIKVK